MAKGFQNDLSRRERQIMDILYAQGPSTAAEVQELLPDPPSYSAVRAMLRVLEDKSHIEHEQDGPRYVYRPCVERSRAQRRALRHVIETFFDGSREAVVAALLEDREDVLDQGELDRLGRLVELARHQEER